MSNDISGAEVRNLRTGRLIMDQDPRLSHLRADPYRFLKLPNEPFYEVLSEMQDVFMWSSVEFWRARGTRYIFLPITTNAVSSPMGLGSDSKPVRVNLEGVETYLADSMQFFLEYACRIWRGGAYYMMPSFRGDAVDRTHLSQFTHMEAELPLGLGGLMDVVEQYILHVCTRIVESRLAREVDLAHVFKLVEAGAAAFRRMSFDEVVDVVGDRPGFVRTIVPEARTLTRAGEEKAISVIGEFLWITDWDQLAVPFYQRAAPGMHMKARCADLLFGPGEVVGAGERHVSGSDVRSALKLHQVEAGDYRWYVEMKENFPLNTSGFGLGVDRFLMWVLRHADIRDLQILMRENGVLHVP